MPITFVLARNCMNRRHLRQTCDVGNADFDRKWTATPLIAGPEALAVFSVRRRKERELLLKIGGMLSRGDGHRDFFSIPQNGDWNVFVGGQKK
jgi:hypothetical protein